jgi:hypothetical protein
VGQLADNVFEPQAQSPGAGIGLMHMIAGSVVVIVAGCFYAWPAVRHLEQILPDFVAGNENI